MKIAVVGAAGRMGRWFSEYFFQKGHELFLQDVRQNEVQALAKKLGVTIVNDIPEAVNVADILFFTTPIEAMSEALLSLDSLVKGKVVVEIASVKGPVLDAVRTVAKFGAKTISIHPMFGPGASRLKGLTVALIPISDFETERRITVELLPEAEVVSLDVETHDRIMATVLSLPHFLNLAFSMSLPEQGMEYVRKLFGPTYALQSVLAESVLSEDPQLIYALCKLNRYSEESLARFVGNANKLMDIIQCSDREVFASAMEKGRSRLESSGRMLGTGSYRAMYRMFESLKNGSFSN